MTGLLLLLGFAISAFSVCGLFDDNTASDNDEPDDAEPIGMVDTETIDIIIDSEFETALTDALGADGVEGAQFLDGPLNIDTGGGDDIIVAGSGDDTLVLGSGDDAGSGGAGDDTVDLGSGNDIYGSEATAFSPDPVFGNTDLGDDTVFGGAGDDSIIDLFGSNILDGGDGDDVLQALDAVSEGDITPDRLTGGDGDDTFVVDQGDVVLTGSGNDEVRIVLGDETGVIEGSEVVTIEDFDITNDLVQLGGSFEADELSIEVLESGNGSTIFWNDTPVVVVFGGQDLTLADVVIAG